MHDYSAVASSGYGQSKPKGKARGRQAQSSAGSTDEEQDEPASPPVSADAQLWTQDILTRLGTVEERTKKLAAIRHQKGSLNRWIQPLFVRGEPFHYVPEHTWTFWNRRSPRVLAQYFGEDCVLDFQHGTSFAWTCTVCHHVRHNQPLVHVCKRQVQSSWFHHRAYVPNCVALVCGECLNAWKHSLNYSYSENAHDRDIPALCINCIGGKFVQTADGAVTTIVPQHWETLE
eukprot:EG_transcript_25142